MHHVASRAVALRDDTGKPVRLVGTNREVTTERVGSAERERLLADTEAARMSADIARSRMEALLQHLPVGVSLAEAPSGQLLVSNDAVRRIWGLDTRAARADDYGSAYIGYHSAEGPERGRRYESDEWPLSRAMATGEPVRDELIEIERPDGTRRMVSINAAPVHDASGTVVGGVVMTQDVTDSVHLLAAEREARARTERLQALTAALARARTMDDVATVVVAEMVTAMGAKTGALAMRDDDALVLLRTVGFPEMLESHVHRQRLDLPSPLTECFRTQAPVWIETREGPAGLDARFPTIAPIWDGLGVASAAFVPLVAADETVGVISFSFVGERAFTVPEKAFLLALGQQAALAVERARLFQAEIQARSEAEAANRAKGEFLAVMSHELRTPLNAIGGYAALMEIGIRGPVTAAQMEDLRRIQASQRHLLGLINEVLNYAKLETGTVQYDVTTILVCNALEGAEALVDPQAFAKHVSLAVTDCPPDAIVHADAEKLQQVLVNLLSNAVKFTQPGGAIELACRVVGALVEITVRDTGIGIPKDQLERIFDPFVQVRSDFTRTHEGTGLGLAISRDLARGMGGELTVDSDIAVGSVFTLSLPTA